MDHSRLRHPPKFMANSELEAIRQINGKGDSQHAMGEQQKSEQNARQEEQKRDAEVQRIQFLSNIISSKGRERLGRIAMVKPEKVRSIEDSLLSAAQCGRIAQVVSDEQIKSLLEHHSHETAKKTKVTIQRRRNALEDD